MKIVSYPRRKVRNPDTQTNQTIRIFAIICMPSKEAGRQYTMRIRPDFLSRYCVIRQDLVFEAYSQMDDEKPSIKFLEDLSLKLGCMDLRTANKHITRIQKRLGKVQKIISEFLSRRYYNIPEITPQRSMISATEAVISCLSNYLVSIYGKVIPDTHYEVLSIMNLLVLRSDISTTFAFNSVTFQDTS